jgi:hypothetical protein
VNDEFETMWKKQLWSNLRYYPGIHLKGLEENHKKPVRITGLQAKI